MDVYEFSERDDQSSKLSKSTKVKKRKSKDISTLKNVSTVKRVRTKRNKLTNTCNLENDSELNPPIRLKLIRDQSDPQFFKSIQVINDVSHSSDFSFDINQQSMLQCKLLDGREFALNDIVWAKISGYPFWPSKILSINLSSSNQKSVKVSSLQNGCQSRLDLPDEFIACVEWLAYDQISYVNCTNLSHFHLDFSNKYNGKLKNKKYYEAVNEAKHLCEENTRHIYDCIGNNQPIDSVHSCDTIEADTSSTLPSHNFTSPESNQSVQSSYCPRAPGARSGPLSNQSDRSLHSTIDFPSHVSDLQNAHKSIFCTSSTTLSTNWELPDLGSNLDFESNNHIPEFSDYEDDCDNIDIAKIEFLIDETYKGTNS